MQTTAIIVSAGRGLRAGGSVPKQYGLLGDAPVLHLTLSKFAGRADIHAIVLVVHPDDAALYTPIVAQFPGLIVVSGGASRDESVRNGLNAAPEGTEAVLIHDAARPLVSDQVITDVLAALETHDGAAPALPGTDALWRADGTKILAPHPRDGLFRAQTPQGFDLDKILAAHAALEGPAADDVEVALKAGLDVALTQGDEDNIKITHPADFKRAERILGDKMDIRTGNGFDVHRFCDGDHVILCGVKIPHDRALKGHSDADVGMHTITDAIYGALAEGDIGQHFPPSDPQWKGAESHIFLRHACDLARSKGFQITHIDCTLICERPKIGPHAQAMRAALADIMELEIDRISVKATTSEKLGFTGREEGIAALGTATLVKT